MESRVYRSDMDKLTAEWRAAYDAFRDAEATAQRDGTSGARSHGLYLKYERAGEAVFAQLKDEVLGDLRSKYALRSGG